MRSPVCPAASSSVRCESGADVWGDHATCSCVLSQLRSGGADLGAFWAERPVALNVDGAFGCIPRALLCCWALPLLGGLVWGLGSCQASLRQGPAP